MNTRPKRLRVGLAIVATTVGAGLGGAAIAGAATSTSTSSTGSSSTSATSTAPSNAPDPATLKNGPGETLLTSPRGQLEPWRLERAIRKARGKVDDLPAGFRYHDLRHYLASLLIASGADVKTVQARLRHASAKTTLDTYGHPWPDADESARAAVGVVLAARADSLSKTRNLAD